MSVLFVVVSLHAAGHFIAAKLLGVRVSWCAVGFGKPLYSRLIGETTYSLKLLPVWCRVRVDGDAHPLIVQSAVIVAGPLCSLVSAWLIAFSMFMLQGVNREYRGPVEIRAILAGSVAERAGFRINDRLLSIDGLPVESSEAVTEIVLNSAGRALQFVIERPREEPAPASAALTEFDRLSLQAAAERISDSTLDALGSSKEGYRLGIEMTPAIVEVGRFNVRLSVEGASKLCRFALAGLKNLILPGDAAEDFNAIQVIRLAQPPPDLSMLTRIVLVWMLGAFTPSLILGLINLLPLPFLDGGRLVKVTLKRVL